MPTYKITLDDGLVATVESDTPPTIKEGFFIVGSAYFKALAVKAIVPVLQKSFDGLEIIQHTIEDENENNSDDPNKEFVTTQTLGPVERDNVIAYIKEHWNQLVPDPSELFKYMDIVEGQSTHLAAYLHSLKLDLDDAHWIWEKVRKLAKAAILTAKLDVIDARTGSPLLDES